jgi:hypothetical protein
MPTKKKHKEFTRTYKQERQYAVHEFGRAREEGFSSLRCAAQNAQRARAAIQKNAVRACLTDAFSLCKKRGAPKEIATFIIMMKTNPVLCARDPRARLLSARKSEHAPTYSHQKQYIPSFESPPEPPPTLSASLAQSTSHDHKSFILL